MKSITTRSTLLLIFGGLLLITELYEILPESGQAYSKMAVEATFGTVGVGVIGTGVNGYGGGGHYEPPMIPPVKKVFVKKVIVENSGVGGPGYLHRHGGYASGVNIGMVGGGGYGGGYGGYKK